MSKIVKWEYFFFSITTPDYGKIEKRFDEMGKKGWELVQMVSSVLAVFKRRMT